MQKLTRKSRKLEDKLARKKYLIYVKRVYGLQPPNSGEICNSSKIFLNPKAVTASNCR